MKFAVMCDIWGNKTALDKVLSILDGTDAEAIAKKRGWIMPKGRSKRKRQ